MPDIFLQKQRLTDYYVTTNQYENYYEIYIQKLHKNKQMFCLQHTNNTLILFKQEKGPNDNIPLVDFVDVDSDGMIDIVFYSEKSIYVYYNMHSHLPFTNSYNELPNLCKKWDEVETGPIFTNYSSIAFKDN